MRNTVLLLVAAAAVAAAELGHIENFQAVSGDGQIVLEWDYVAGDSSYTLHKYRLITDGDSSSDIPCRDSHCSFTAVYMEACKEHTFELIPIFDDLTNGGTVEGDSVTITGYTIDEEVSAPSNLRIVSENDSGTTLQWNAPAENPICAKSYEVCSRLDGFQESQCQTVSDTTVMMTSLQACGKYHVTVTPVTPSGAEGTALEDTIETELGAPGPPVDVVVGLITKTTIEIMWNDPDINPLCVKDYAITYGAITTRVGRSAPRAEEDYDNRATISPLDACTNYSIEVVSVGEGGLSSAPVTKYAATDDTVPQPVPYIEVDPASEDSIVVHWGKDENDRCAASYIICWTDGIHPQDYCVNVSDSSSGYTITDLLPCTTYQVTVTVASSSGLDSVVVGNSTATYDVAPEPVNNLQVIESHTNELTVTFELPEVNKQCVETYDLQVTDLDQSGLMASRATDFIETFITGLEACTNYLIELRLLSPTGKASAWREVRNKTQDGIPSSPREFGLNGVTKDSISLEWFQPEINKRCASEYIITWEASDGTRGGPQNVIDPTEFKVIYTVTGLKECTDYTFSLVAKSSVGQSNPTEFTYTTLCS